MKKPSLLFCVSLVMFFATAVRAQVYSVNAVASIPKTIPRGGFALIQNPLDASTVGGNVVSNVLAGVPNCTRVYQWSTQEKKFLVNDYTDLFGWSDPNMPMAPGGGVFVHAPPNSDITIVFVGEIPQGKDPTPLIIPLVPGLQIVGSKVPQAATVEQLGYTASDGDAVYQWSIAGQKYDHSQYSTDFGWDPPLKVLDIGDAVFVSRLTSGSWTRSFSVNN